MVVIQMKLINKNKIHFHEDTFNGNQSKLGGFVNHFFVYFLYFSLTENNRESAKKRIVPANPVLKRRIPSFLRVYSQASSSNDILLQWQLFSLSELQSFDAMMTKLYKDENLARVKFYEMYRVLLTSILASKTSANRVNIRNYNDNDDDAITTTAL
jgi:hypothetical protein